MSLPPDRAQNTRRPSTRGPVGGAMSYWMKEPYYMAKWTYFHRPGVWNAVGGPKGLQWHGLYGFKTLLAGSGGLSYTGGQRTQAAPGMKWILRGAGRGLEGIGTGFRAMDPGIIRRRYLGPGLPDTALAGRIGAGFQRFGAGVRGGGLAGGVRGLGSKAAPVADWITKIGGGYTTGFGRIGLTDPGGALSRGIYGTLAQRGVKGIGVGGAMTAAVGELDDLLLSRVRSKVGVGGLLRPGKYTERVLDTLSPSQLKLFKMTGKKGGAALTRGVIAKGATRLMAGAAVGLNIALFGGMAMNLGMAGARALGDAAWGLQMGRRGPALEFGTGIDPFPESLTERQRAVQAIGASHLNARVGMGREAEILHS